MNKHTPGPWRYTHDEGDDFALNGQAGESIVGGCGCCGSPFLGGADVEADARLIAAAPELLEACKRLIGGLHVMVGDGDNDGDIVFARNVIAKATGETP